jgi:hypothetical protein
MAKEATNPTPTTNSTGSKSLVGKLVEVMHEITHVEKRGNSPQLNYSFVKAADLAHLVRNKLADRNVLMTADIVEVTHSSFLTNKGTTMQVCNMKVRYTFHDGDSDKELSFHGYGGAFDTGDKATYKAQTGALKYALRTAFLVPDEKGDPEADGSVDAETSKEFVKPEPLTGKVENVSVRDVEDGHEVWLKVGGKVLVSTTEPNMSRLLDSEGKTFEFLVSDLGRKAKGNKTALTIHSVFPIPETKEAVAN